MVRRLVVAIVTVASLAACADDGSSTADTSDVTSTDVEASPEPTEAAPAAAQGSPSDAGASGSIRLTSEVRDISADVVACSNDSETQVAISAQAETSAIEITPAGGDRVAVTISGTLEWEGNGTVVVSDTGGVRIEGIGAPADPSAPVENFVIEGTIVSC